MKSMNTGAASKWAWLLGLFCSLGACHTAHEEILISARPATVWKVVHDAPRYEEWNPMLVKIEGQFVEEQRIHVSLKEPDGGINRFSSTVREVVPQEKINQGGGLPGLFTFDHTFRLKPQGDATHLTVHEEFRGIGVLFFEMDWVSESYKKMLQAIKTRAEALERRSR